MNKKSFGNKLVASPYIVWSAIFIIVPLVIMFYFALTDNNGVFTLANITAIGKYKKSVRNFNTLRRGFHRYNPDACIPHGIFYDKA